MCSFICDHDFASFYSIDNVEVLLSQLKSVINNAICKFVPSIKICSSRLPKWFTPAIKHKLNKLRFLRKKCRHHPTAALSSKILSIESAAALELSGK